MRCSSPRQSALHGGSPGSPSVAAHPAANPNDTSMATNVRSPACRACLIARLSASMVSRRVAWFVTRTGLVRSSLPLATQHESDPNVGVAAPDQSTMRARSKRASLTWSAALGAGCREMRWPRRNALVADHQADAARRTRPGDREAQVPRRPSQPVGHPGSSGRPRRSRTARCHCPAGPETTGPGGTPSRRCFTSVA